MAMPLSGVRGAVSSGGMVLTGSRCRLGMTTPVTYSGQLLVTLTEAVVYLRSQRRLEKQTGAQAKRRAERRPSSLDCCTKCPICGLDNERNRRLACLLISIEPCSGACL